MLSYAREALPSVPDLLKCESMKILDGKASAIPLPYAFAQILSNYGDALFEDSGKQKAVDEYKSKLPTLNKIFSKMQSEATGITFRLNRAMHFEALLTVIESKDYGRFCDKARGGSEKSMSYYSSDESEQMIEAFGTPQLREHIENMARENGYADELLKKLGQAINEMRTILDNRESTKEAIGILQNLDDFMKKIMGCLCQYRLDSSLLKDFYEKRMGAKAVGCKLKTKEY